MNYFIVTDTLDENDVHYMAEVKNAAEGCGYIVFEVNKFDNPELLEGDSNV